MIFQFEATLMGVDKKVSRTFEMDGNASFSDLHKVMQVLFDWQEYHLYGFFIRKSNGVNIEGKEIGPIIKEEVESGFFKKHNDTEEILSAWFTKINDNVSYIYDFGDDWEHNIQLVKKYEDKDQNNHVPKCIQVINLAPPEDSRFETIEGIIDLTFENSDVLVNQINERLNKHNQPKKQEAEETTNHWERTLQLSKDFLQAKPWEIMNDEHIFVMDHPELDDKLYCSVIGHQGEVFGLVVYLGVEGFYSLINTLSKDKESSFFDPGTQCLLLTFEDRNDLEKSEYDLIKTHNTTFHGKKAWPSFISFSSGYYPWSLTNDQAKIMGIAIIETLNVLEEVKSGLDMPYITNDEQILFRSYREDTGTYESKVIDISDEELLGSGQPLTLSELDLKRLSKYKKPLDISIEFVLISINIPIQENPNERPVLPLFAVALNGKDGEIIDHQVLNGVIDAETSQKALLDLVQKLGGIPSMIYTNPTTFRFTAPLAMDLPIAIAENLPFMDLFIENFYESISKTN